MSKFRPFKNLLIVVVFIAFFCMASVWIINHPRTLKYALSISSLGHDWKVGIKQLKFDPLRSSIELKGISTKNEKLGKEFYAKRLFISYRLFGFLRGRIIIDHIEVDDVTIDLTGPKQKRPHKRLNIAKLVLLKNLEIRDAKIQGLSLRFGDGKYIVADQTFLELTPNILGDSSVTMRIDGTYFAKSEKEQILAGIVKFSATTNLLKWHEDFPYINAIDGNFKIGGLDFTGIAAESFESKIKLADDQLSLDDIKLIVDGRTLNGAIDVNTSDQNFSAKIDIPKPIALPYIGTELDTMSTAGEVSGQISLKGSHFTLRDSNANGQMDIMYKFSTSATAPVRIISGLSLSGGALNFNNARIIAGADEASADAKVDFANKNFKAQAQGQGFPIEHVFEKFNNPHLKKIFGKTNFTGTFEGWGRKFLATVKGTTLGGGWEPITAQKINTELEATYDVLKMSNEIYSGENHTGKSLLVIKYGPKTGHKDRTKDITLDSSLTNHPVEDSLAEYKLEGTGTGHIKITGPHTAFRGEVKARVENGKWHNLPFENAATDMALSNRGIVFSNLALKLSDREKPKLTGPVTADINNGVMRFTGSLATGLSLDTTYRTKEERWQLSKITWNDPDRLGDILNASGTITKGNSDLKISGRIDVASMAYVLPFIRSGSGPLDLNLNMHGSFANPTAAGEIKFNGNELSPRGAAITFDDLNGSLKFNGPHILFSDFSAKIDDGFIKVSGGLSHKNLKTDNYDLEVSGKAMRYRTLGGDFNVELDGDLKLTGPENSPLLSGNVTIIDGKYSKDFNILDAFALGKKNKKPKKAEKIIFDPRLDLKIQNTGDLAIRNNAGDIWLNVDVGVKGTRKKPVMSGVIDTADGKVHYLGMEFDVTRGFVEFRENYSEPYLEIYAQKEVGLYNTNLIMYGPIDNLALDLTASSPTGQLDKRDAVSMLIFGVTDQERDSFSRQNLGGQVSSSIVGQAITGIVGRPISKITHLDVIRLESAESGTSNISRIYLGKQLSDRMTINFATDINTDQAVQTVEGEYMITDNILFKGSRSSDSTYRVSGTVRFRMR